MIAALWIAGGALLAAIAYVASSYWRIRRSTMARLADAVPRPRHAATRPRSRLRHWLDRAGYRHPSAVSNFTAATVAAVAMGGLVVLMYNAFARQPLIAMVANVPGGMGDVLAAVLEPGGWILFLIIVLTPTLVVRAARRRRVRDIERDLPLVLELFSTMAEAGLGFDAALARVVQSQRGDRPLVTELASYQRDTLAGIARLSALRRLAERVDVFSVTSFTSAVIHAEHVGASMAETLRHQAESIRDRRREQALLDAQSMPVKLVFPLVILFPAGDLPLDPGARALPDDSGLDLRASRIGALTFVVHRRSPTRAVPSTGSPAFRDRRRSRLRYDVAVASDGMHRARRAAGGAPRRIRRALAHGVRRERTCRVRLAAFADRAAVARVPCACGIRVRAGGARL
ncbi:MAG: type II secretion system F family protein [Vicinamibacterales bacterium]